MKSEDVNWFLGMAQYVSTRSKDPSTKCGAVIVNKLSRAVVSVGYNGFPRNFLDTKERLENREYKYKHTLHAEQNAMIFSNRTYLDDCCIFVTHPPCARCLVEMRQRNLTTVYCFDGDEEFKKRLAIPDVLEVANELGIEIIFV